MFPLLTQYLLHNKKVSIPNIGSFIIEQQPAELNFVDRLLLPPAYKIIFANANTEDEELVSFIGNNAHIDQNTARQKLETFGAALKNKLQEAPFEWNGIGQLEYKDNVVFHPNKIGNSLQPVPANKVIRDNQQHTVLVGEQELQSGDIEQSRLRKGDVKRQIHVPVLIGWIVLVAALAFLGYHIYSHQNVKEATGLRTEIKPAPPQPSHK